MAALRRVAIEQGHAERAVQAARELALAAGGIEGLDTDLRPKLIELLGDDFDFTALTEVDDTVREYVAPILPYNPSPLGMPLGVACRSSSG